MVKTGYKKNIDDGTGVYKLSPNEEARLIQEDKERRRKMRIVQVREQARANAANVRNEVKAEKRRQISRLANEVEKELDEVQAEQIRQLENNFENCVRTIGQGHHSADQQPSLEDGKRVALEYHDGRTKERGRVAVDKLNRDKTVERAVKMKQIHARCAALDTERKRSALVAALPAPPPDPLSQLVLAKPKRSVGVTDTAAFSTTHYHIPADNLVHKALHDTQSASEAAEAEAARQEDEGASQRRLKNERLERARVRHIVAREKELLKHDYDAMLHDLSDLQRDDKLRRQKIVDKIPKQVFVPPHKRLAEKEERKKDIEHEFEDLYMKATDQVGDLSMALDTLPAVPSPTETLDLSTADPPEASQVSSVETDTKPGDVGAAGEATRSSVLADITRNKSTDGALKRLMGRIKTQRVEWTQESDDATEHTQLTSPVGTSVSDKENRLPHDVANVAQESRHAPAIKRAAGIQEDTESGHTVSDERPGLQTSADLSRDLHESHMEIIRRQQREIMLRKKQLEERLMEMETHSPRRTNTTDTSLRANRTTGDAGRGETTTTVDGAKSLASLAHKDNKEVSGTVAVGAVDTGRIRSFQASLLTRQTENWKVYSDTRAKIDERRRELMAKFPTMDVSQFGRLDASPRRDIASPLKRNVLGIASQSNVLRNSSVLAGFTGATSGVSEGLSESKRFAESPPPDSSAIESSSCLTTSSVSSDIDRFLLTQKSSGLVNRAEREPALVVNEPISDGGIRKYLSFTDDEDDDDDVEISEKEQRHMSRGLCPQVYAWNDAANEKSRRVELENMLRSVIDSHDGVNLGAGHSAAGYPPIPEYRNLSEHTTKYPSASRDFISSLKNPTKAKSTTSSHPTESRIRDLDIPAAGVKLDYPSLRDAITGKSLARTPPEAQELCDRPPINLSLYRMNSHVPHELSLIQERDSTGTVRFSSSSAQFQVTDPRALLSLSLSEGPLSPLRDADEDDADDTLGDVPHIDGITIQSAPVTTGQSASHVTAYGPSATRPASHITTRGASFGIHDKEAYHNSRAEDWASTVVPAAARRLFRDPEGSPDVDDLAYQTSSTGSSAASTEISDYPLSESRTVASAARQVVAHTSWVSPLRVPLLSRSLTDGRAVLRSPNRTVKDRPYEREIVNENAGTHETDGQDAEPRNPSGSLEWLKSTSVNSSKFQSLDARSDTSSASRSAASGMSEKSGELSAASVDRGDGTATVKDGDALSDYSIKEIDSGNVGSTDLSHDSRNWADILRDDSQSFSRPHLRESATDSVELKKDASVSPTAGIVHIGISPAYHRHLQTYSPAKIRQEMAISTAIDYQPYIHDDPLNRPAPTTPKKSAYEPVFVGMSPSYRSYLSSSSPAKLRSDDMWAAKVDYQPYLTSEPRTPRSPTSHPQSERVHIGVSPLYKSHRSSPRRPVSEKKLPKHKSAFPTQEVTPVFVTPFESKKAMTSVSPLSQHTLKTSSLTDSTSYYSLPEHGASTGRESRGTTADEDKELHKPLRWETPVLESNERVWLNSEKEQMAKSQKAVVVTKSIVGQNSPFVDPRKKPTPVKHPSNSNSKLSTKASKHTRSTARPTTSLYQRPRTPKRATPGVTKTDWVSSLRSSTNVTPSKSPATPKSKKKAPATDLGQYSAALAKMSKETLADILQKVQADVGRRKHDDLQKRLFDSFADEPGIMDVTDLTLVSIRSDMSFANDDGSTGDVNLNNHTDYFDDNDRATEPHEKSDGVVIDVLHPPDESHSNTKVETELYSGKIPEKSAHSASSYSCDQTERADSYRGDSREQTAGYRDDPNEQTGGYRSDLKEQTDSDEADDMSESLVSFMQHETSVLKRRSEALGNQDPVSLQEMFLARKSGFVKNSEMRVTAIKEAAPKLVSTVASWKRNRSIKGVVSTKAVRRSMTTPTREKSKSTRLRVERENKERNNRLYSQLDEVRQRSEVAERHKQYAANRQRANEYHNKLQEKRKKHQTSHKK